MNQSLGNSDPMSRDLDALTFSVINHRYEAIVEEMTAALENASWSAMLGLARDFSCAVFDGRGRLVSMFDACPLHVTSMAFVVQAMERELGGSAGDEDMIVCNDPYSGNSHVGDVVFASPVLVEDEVAFWSGVKVHHLDIGAAWPTSMAYMAQDVWTEGMNLPPFRISEDGEVREDLFRLLLANLRYPEQLRGDFLAQMGAVRVGLRGIRELIARYGYQTLRRYTEALQAYASARTGAEIDTWPDGVYHGETWLDSDGQGNEDIRIVAQVAIVGSQVEIDFSGSDPQTNGAANSSAGNTSGAACLPVITCVDPDVPKNDGCQSHVSVDPGPPGTITHARWPAATAIDTALTGDCVQEAVWKALAHAMPEKVMGGVAKCAGINFCSGVDHRGDEPRPWGHVIHNSGGGGGASKEHDGWQHMICYNCMGCLRIPSIEMSELLYPVLFEQLEIEPMSGGAGQWVGGNGVRTVLRPYGGTVTNFVCGDGMLNPPYGALGAEPGCGGGQWHERDDGTRTFHGSKAHIELGPNDRWVCVSSGGGGYGRPIDRDPERVQEDVLDDLLTIQAAEEIYGVVLAQDMTVDLPATNARRVAIEESVVFPTVTPTEPRAAKWLTGVMATDEEFVQDSL